MINIVLFQPEIPPNTGNIIRLASNSGCKLHLIRPLGFDLEEKNLRRAGLDYHEYCIMQVYENWNDFKTICAPRTIYALSTKGDTHYTDARFAEDDYLLFGPESRGLPVSMLESPDITAVLKVPMLAQSRSLNLSNAVAVVAYEAWRQLGFRGAGQ